MTLNEFEAELRRVVGQPTMLRPFVCRGSPLDCQIFLVGFNPATILETDFWTFWRQGFGYDKDAWFEEYLLERSRKPLKPGRTRRHAVSPTRRNIEAFIEGTGTAGVLETNIFSKPSDDMRSLALADREIAPFRFLVEAIKPQLIVSHGKPANEAIDRFFPTSKIIKVAHLSRGISNENARLLGQRVGLHVLNPPALEPAS